MLACHARYHGFESRWGRQKGLVAILGLGGMLFQIHRKYANAGIRRKEGEMQCPYCQRILTKTDTADGYTLTCLVHGIIYQSHYTG